MPNEPVRMGDIGQWVGIEIYNERCTKPYFEKFREKGVAPWLRFLKFLSNRKCSRIGFPKEVLGLIEPILIAVAMI